MGAGGPGDRVAESAGVAIAGYQGFTRVAIGGFSTVYTAHQTRFDRTVAVKVINSDLRDAATVRHFTRECQASGRLSHIPEVATVLDAGATDDGRPFIAMQYFPRGSLADLLLSAGPLSAAEAVGVAAAVARALHAAHAGGVLHRDIKPGNVLVTDGGGVALGDFGVASILRGPDASSQSASQGAHTPQFTAPEVLDGRPYTPAADVYGLGATVHAMLGGSPPFTLRPGEGPAAVFRRILAGDSSPLDGDLPEALRTFVARLMAVVPAQRPTTADIRAELAALAETVGSTPLPPLPDPPLPDRGSTIGTAGGTAGSTAGRSGAEPEQPERPDAPDGIRPDLGPRAAAPPGDDDSAGAEPSPDGIPPAPLGEAAMAPTRLRARADRQLPPPLPAAPAGRRIHRLPLVAAAAATVMLLLLAGIYLLLRPSSAEDVIVPPTVSPTPSASASPATGSPPPTPTPTPTPAPGSSESPRSSPPIVPPGATVPSGGPAGPGAATATTPVPPPPPRPATKTYRFPAGVLSSQLKDGTCVYRIWFGNVGNMPFAKIRVYAGDCGGASITVAAQRGSTITYYGETTWTGGSDSCGSYFEGQATGQGTPAIGVGQTLYFPATGQAYAFMHDRGEPITPYRYC
jgi:serine/threonine protein kinase